MYVYLIFQSTKDVIWKTKTIAKSSILDSQESFIEIPNVYMDIGEITPGERYTYYVIYRKSYRGGRGH